MRTVVTPRNTLQRTLPFLLLTFGLTWGFEWLVARTGGHAEYLLIGLQPLGMFVPATVAVTLRMFVFRDFVAADAGSGRPAVRLLQGFLLVVGINTILTGLALFTNATQKILQFASAFSVSMWTLYVFFLRGKCGAEGFAVRGLTIGDRRLAVAFIAGVVLFLASQSGLNLLSGLGSFVGMRSSVGGVSVAQSFYPLALTVFFLVSVIGTPLASLALVFGEEYGWRGYLQETLSPIGTRAAALITGAVWGVWHLPIFFSGIHTYPPTPAGAVAGVAFFVLAGVVFGYAYVKTRSIWVVAFMHGVMNSVHQFIVVYVVKPDDNLQSFGLGIYGLACLSFVVIAILRDPLWKTGTRRS